jgi:hypothetical protein
MKPGSMKAPFASIVTSALLMFSPTAAMTPSSATSVFVPLKVSVSVSNQ